MIKEQLDNLRLSQTDLARLLEVTTRTVSLWATEQREVPGPVKAYLRLLESLSSIDREKEFARLTKETENMKEGMYGIRFEGSADFGVGALVMQNNSIYGIDIGGVKYDGSYVYNPEKGTIDVKIKVTIPPNVETVQGISNPYEWAFDIQASLPKEFDSHTLDVQTPVGKVRATITYMRSLPMAA